MFSATLWRTVTGGGDMLKHSICTSWLFETGQCDSSVKLPVWIQTIFVQGLMGLSLELLLWGAHPHGRQQQALCEHRRRASGKRERDPTIKIFPFSWMFVPLEHTEAKSCPKTEAPLYLLNVSGFSHWVLLHTLKTNKYLFSMDS